MLRFLVIVALTLCSIVPVSAAPQKQEPQFSLYSDICYHKEAGDVLGLRIGILWLGPNEPFAFVQYGEGDMGEAFLAKVKRRGSHIEFTISDSGRPRSFHGTISDAEIVGNFPNEIVEPSGKTVHHLKREYSRQMGFEDCR